MYYFPIISSGIELQKTESEIDKKLLELNQLLETYKHWNDIREIEIGNPLSYFILEDTNENNQLKDSNIITNNYIELYNIVKVILEQVV